MTDIEMLKSLRHVQLKLVSYYKNAFTFSGERDGYKITAVWSGVGDDVYRFSYNAEEETTLGTYCGPDGEVWCSYIKIEDFVSKKTIEFESEDW